LKLTNKFALLLLIFIWALALSPFYIPAMNTTSKFLGLPFTVALVYICAVLMYLLCQLATRKIWDPFDDGHETEDKE